MKTKEEVLDGMDMIDFLIKCRNDFKFFCEKLLGLTKFGGIHKYQVEWFNLMEKHNRVLIQAPSGFSKTTIFEAYALWVSWNFRDKKIMIVANTEARSKEIVQEINAMIEDNELIQDLKPKNYRETWNKTELRTSTRCRIFLKPYTENMRGERVDFALLDEADSKVYRNISIFTEHVLSRLNPGAKLALISTPDSTTGLMSYIRNINKGEYVFKKYTAIVNCKVEGDLSTGESIWPERFPVEDLLERKKAMGESAFRKVYMCDETAESEDSIFKMAYVMDCFDNKMKFESKPTDGFVVIGCDFAYSSGPKADYDAYVVLEKKDNFFILRQIETHKGVKTPVKVSRIQELEEQYKPSLIICDESNIGSTVIDEMFARGLSVIPQKFSPTERKDLLMVLKNVIENKKLVIPRDPNQPEFINKTNDMTTQLLGFVKRESESTTSEIIDSTAAHDDIVMALAMAVKEASRQITEDFWK